MPGMLIFVVCVCICSYIILEINLVTVTYEAIIDLYGEELKCFIPLICKTVIVPLATRVQILQCHDIVGRAHCWQHIYAGNHHYCPFKCVDVHVGNSFSMKSVWTWK